MPVKLSPYAHPGSFSKLEERWRKVPVAVAVDIHPAACQIDPAIRPLCPTGKQPGLFGRALTVLCEPPDFGAVLHAADMIKPGDVMVIAANGNAETAIIGEIVSGHVRRRGGVGVICDGAVRDVGELANWDNFPVFSRHVTPRGPASANSGAINCPVQFGGQTVSPGDLVLGDNDGLARLTPEMVSDFIQAAEAKLELEAEWVQRLTNGDPVEAVFGLEKPAS
ncbi:MAG: RraA family protein [Pseudomonadota bacterium]